MQRAATDTIVQDEDVLKRVSDLEDEAASSWRRDYIGKRRGILPRSRCIHHINE